MIYFVQGRFVPQEEATVSVLDRGFLYGDSIYETLRSRNGKVLFWKDHHERLHRSARLLDLEIGREEPDPLAILRELMKRNNLATARMRIIVSRGTGGRDQLDGFTPTWVVTIEPFIELTEEEYREGVAAILVSTRRMPIAALSPEIKSSNLLNNLLARREAVRAGAAEGILLNPAGLLAEGAHSNLLWVSPAGTLCTPPCSVGILRGVTRDKVLRAAHALGMPAAEVEAGPEALEQAQEIMLTSTSWEVLSVTRYNGRKVGAGARGEFSRRLREALRALYDDAEETA